MTKINKNVVLKKDLIIVYLTKSIKLCFDNEIKCRVKLGNVIHDKSKDRSNHLMSPKHIFY